MYTYDLTFLRDLSRIGPALVTTLWISVLALFISTMIGVAGALIRRSNSQISRFLIALYVEVFRNIPILVVVYMFFFGLAQIGLRIDNFIATLFAISIGTGAYMVDVFSAALSAIPRGQFEAGETQGFGRFALFRYVIMPQLIRLAFAPYGNLCIAVVLASSLGSVVGVEEVTSWMHTSGSNSFRYLETFTVAAIVYVFIAQTFNLIRLVLGRWLFGRWAGGERA